MAHDPVNCTLWALSLAFLAAAIVTPIIRRHIRVRRTFRRLEWRQL